MAVEVCRLIKAATSITELQAAIAALRNQEDELLDELEDKAKELDDLDCALNRLDSLQETLFSQATASKAINRLLLANATNDVLQISNNAYDLGLERKRVASTLTEVDHLVELKTCISGTVASMGSLRDWEAAAEYLHRASKIPEETTRSAFSSIIVPSIEAPELPWVTLESARERLCALFVKEFKVSAKLGNASNMARFFKLFPLIGKENIGLEVYGEYICQDMREMIKTKLDETEEHSRTDDLIYAELFAKLFEHVANVVQSHQSVIERYYGPAKISAIIERLQLEVDVQGHNILDAWSKARRVAEMTAMCKEQRISNVSHSLKMQPKGSISAFKFFAGAATGTTSSDSQNEGMSDLHVIHQRVTEIAYMLRNWSLYNQFIAKKLVNTIAQTDSLLVRPEILVKSILCKKIEDKLSEPYRLMVSFFFQRSIEKMLQLDLARGHKSPPELRKDSPPIVLSAVGDIMYITDRLIQDTLLTQNKEVTVRILALISRSLESDFLGVLQTKLAAGGAYTISESLGSSTMKSHTTEFVMFLNTVSKAREYLRRILQKQLEPFHEIGKKGHSLQELFPFRHEYVLVEKAIKSVCTGFTLQTTNTLMDGLRKLLHLVLKPQLQQVLRNSFKAADYSKVDVGLGETEVNEDNEGPARVADCFADGWLELMRPLSHMMNSDIYIELLNLTAINLANKLEKHIWSHAAHISETGSIQMEQDFSKIVEVVSVQNYQVRKHFSRVQQILMIVNMEEEEWIEATSGSSDVHIVWVPDDITKAKARGIARR